jgi:hypothetical protein
LDIYGIVTMQAVVKLLPMNHIHHIRKQVT